MRRFCHFGSSRTFEGQKGRPAAPKKVSVDCTKRSDEGKTVVTLIRRPLLSCCRAYPTFHHTVKCFSPTLVSRTQCGNVEAGETPEHMNMPPPTVTPYFRFYFAQTRGERDSVVSRLTDRLIAFTFLLKLLSFAILCFVGQTTLLAMLLRSSPRACPMVASVWPVCHGGFA